MHPDLRRQEVHLAGDGLDGYGGLGLMQLRCEGWANHLAGVGVQRAPVVRGLRMRRALVGAALAAAVLVGAEGARADDASPRPDPPRQDRWYGYQTLIADGVAIATSSTGVALTVSEAKAGGNDANPLPGLALAGLGATTYLLGAPIVHWAHGRVGVGFISLGMRILAPLAGLGLGAVGSELANGSKNQIGIPIGAAAGALTAVLLDATLLGWQRTSSDGVTNKPPAAALLLPTLVVSKQAFALGMTWRL